MAVQATGVFDPNEYYRLTNLALGGEFSLDVDGSKDIPDGKLGMAPSGLYTGQIYQILENADDPGHYWFATSWLGAKEKMDAVINDRGDYAPFLRNFTTDYNQTWGLTPHNDVANNRTTWTIMPDWFGGLGSGLAMSVYNDTKQPYLATPGPNPDLGHGDVNQAWFITKEGLTIDDPTFSATNLPALATAAPIVPEGVTASADATPTPTGGSSSKESNETDHLAGPLIAAAVVPTVTVFLSVIAFVAFICLRRRRARRMARNMPYGSGTTAAAASKDGLASEILDTFSVETLGHWRRRHAADRGEKGQPPPPFSQSVASSHLSEPRLPRLPEDSAMSINPRANPLRPPPLRTTSSSRGNPQLHGRPAFFGASALGLSDNDATLTSQDLYHMQIEELSGLSPTRKPPWMEERSPSVMEGKGMEVLGVTSRDDHIHEERQEMDGRPRSLFELENTRPASRYELE